MIVALSPFAENGHLHDLGLDAYVASALSVETMAEVDAHLATCEACEQRVSDAHREEAVPLPALRRGPTAVSDGSMTAVPDAANRPWRAWLAPATVVAAAFLGFLASPMPSSTAAHPHDHDHDTLRVKSANHPIRLEVWADEGPRSRPVRDRQETLDDDRLGFRMQTREDGHVMILGVDDAGEPWQGYPQDGGGSVSTMANGTIEDIGAAVQLDGKAGQERIVALWCPDSYEFDEVADRMVELSRITEFDRKLDEIREGCEQSEVRVKKVRKR